MTFNSELLITRQPIVDRNRDVAFFVLSAVSAERDMVTPFMLHLANIEIPQAVYFLPIDWIGDEVLLKKLAHDMILLVAAERVAEPIAETAHEHGFRIALSADGDRPAPAGAESDFVIAPWKSGISASTDTIYTGIETPEEEELAKSTTAMYFGGEYLMGGAVPVAGGKRINPGHALILELMSAVQQEAEPKTIDALFKRDVTLSFKLLRYINSPWFGLATHVESVRHALSIIGCQQLLKWLTLLAATAGGNTSPALTHAAIARAKLMELVGSKMLDKRETDSLFVTGMLTSLDRLMGVPMEEILAHVNLPPGVTDAILRQEGRYGRFLRLAMACEGHPLTNPDELADIDVKAVNNAHLEAIEWATQAMRDTA